MTTITAEKRVEAVSAKDLLADYGVDPSSAFRTLYKASKSSSNGVACLGGSKDGTHLGFAAILPGADSPALVIVQETAPVKCAVSGRNIDPGNVTRSFYLGEDGRTYMCESPVELEDLGLTDAERELVCETALRALVRCKFRLEHRVQA